MLENILKYQEIEGNLIAEENDLLKSKDRAKASQVVDARGLILKHVGYDNVEDYIQKINSQKEGI